MSPRTQQQEDEIVRRRFGSRHANPCRDPAMIECARWACQEANKCQLPGPEVRRRKRAALKVQKGWSDAGS